MKICFFMEENLHFTGVSYNFFPMYCQEHNFFVTKNGIKIVHGAGFQFNNPNSVYNKIFNYFKTVICKYLFRFRFDFQLKHSIYLLKKIDLKKERLTLINELTSVMQKMKFGDQCARQLNYTLIGFYDELKQNTIIIQTQN